MGNNFGPRHSYGTYTQVGWKSAAAILDWGSADSLSVWIKVSKAPSLPELMSFRMQVTDRDAAGTMETWVYQHNTIIDAAKGWVNLHIPLFERMSDGTAAPDSTGFSIAPANWNFSQNDKKFNTDKISSWYFTVLPTSIAADSVEVKYDKFEMFGSKPVPVTIFNGITFPSPVKGAPWAWGNSGISIEPGIGIVAGSNALKWVQGDQWANGFTGWGVDLDPTNMSGGWAKDTLQFKMKADTGTGKIRVQIEDGTEGGKRGVNVTPMTDNKWNTYKIALNKFVYPPGEDQAKKGPIDSTKITKFGIMAEASAKIGKIVYLTDIWTGNPVFDVIPPAAPTGVMGVPGAPGTYTNIATWNDVPNEIGAKYDVFFSTKRFTAVDSTIDDLPPYKILSGTMVTNHLLRAPLTDQNVTYFYGVRAIDAAGNAGPVAVSLSSITSKAQGVPTISKTPPVNFKADGILSAGEWSSIVPIALNAFGKMPTAHVVSNGVVKDSMDLSAKVYMGVDAANLYIAYDVVDDTVAVDTASETTWAQDSPDLNIGLYDWRGPHHEGYARGATPDYMLRFSQNRVNDDHSGKIVMYPGANYAWKRKPLSPGYIVEAKIPFAVFAAISPGDKVFEPREGMRIPIDFTINDRDGVNRDAILAYSPLNNDNSYQNMYNWTYTWIGALWSTGVIHQEETAVRSFELLQNFPNPFNPATTIRYSIPAAGQVAMKIFDLLGREVMNVVDGYQQAGSYTATVDAGHLSTGMYVYKLESGSYSAVKKMLLVR